jgi:hypothetical protein
VRDASHAPGAAARARGGVHAMRRAVGVPQSLKSLHAKNQPALAAMVQEWYMREGSYHIFIFPGRRVRALKIRQINNAIFKKVPHDAWIR